MTLPLYDNGALSGLLAGLLFGFVLEGAGFGSPRKLTGQFTLRDFSVFKVMFTAVVVAATGLWLADATGIMPLGKVYVPTLYFWSIAAGGALIGAGFSVGGYCPGTSAVGFASGRLDAIAFIAGMVVGVAVFAGAFDAIEPFYRAAKGPARQTLDQLLGLPAPVILVAFAAMAAGGFWLGSRIERRNGGPVTPDDTMGSRSSGSFGAHEAPAAKAAV